MLGFTKHILSLTCTNFCPPERVRAAAVLSNPCYSPCFEPCRPDYCPPEPIAPDECVPSEAACQALREIGLILQSLNDNLYRAVIREINDAFRELYRSLLEIDVRTASELYALAQHLEQDVLALVKERLISLLFCIKHAIRADFAKSRTVGAAALAQAKDDIAAKISALSQESPPAIKNDLEDTQNGYQSDAFAAANLITGALLASYAKQEKDILSKIAQCIANEKALISAAIAKLFKEFEKNARALDAAFVAQQKKQIEQTKLHLENNISDAIDRILSKDAYLVVSILKRLIERLTGCGYVEGVYPVQFLTAPQQYHQDYQEQYHYCNR